MKYLKIKDKKNRFKFYNLEIKNNINKFLYIKFLNSNKFSNLRKKIMFKFLSLKSTNFRHKNRVVRRCKLTNRGRGTFQKFHISRILLRELMSFGIIPGYTKAVW